jgi:putative Mn2+ efflux pump MntP
VSHTWPLPKDFERHQAGLAADARHSSRPTRRTMATIVGSLGGAHDRIDRRQDVGTRAFARLRHVRGRRWAGNEGLTRGAQYRYGATLGLAEGTIPLIGFLLGQLVASAIGQLASYSAVVLLFGVGLYSMPEATHEKEQEYATPSLLSLLTVAVSVSLDELAVGFSFGLPHIPILLAVALIALQAFILTLVGTTLGTVIGEKVAKRAGLLSGVVLTLLALFLPGEKLIGA